MRASARKSGPSRRRSRASSGEKSPIADLIQNPQLGRRRRQQVKVQTLVVDAPCRRYSRRGSRPIGGKMALQGRFALRSMKQMESRLESRMDRLEARVREDLKRLDDRVARLEHSQAKLEGLLEGLREAITRPTSGVR